MSEAEQTRTIRVAVPSEAPGGLDAPCAGHFGRCSHFTVADLVDGQITQTATVENLPHHEGGCMAPVMMLAQNGVEALVVSGIGGRPLMGCEQLGIAVFAVDGGDVAGAFAAFAEGRLTRVGPEGACQH
jgi:predicted Fe-Mo cluster-binding NifX family protein